LLVKCNMHL